MTCIHVIHENAAWLEPLAQALDRQGLPWREWFLDRGVFDLSRPPPEGVFYNRMSASSHTRNHRYAAELTASVLAWLERHGRRVVNGSRALDLEISKARQYAALEKAGIRTPDTVLVAGTELLVEAARRHFGGGPFILKPNRGGKGLGVRLFHTSRGIGRPPRQPRLRAAGRRPPSAAAIRARILAADHPRRIHRRPVPLRGRVDTQDGFELCPADACAVGDAFCPADPGAEPGQPRAKFTIIDDIDPSLKCRCEAFLAANDIEVAGIEFIADRDGTVYIYDVNTNTNYNPDAEVRAGRSGMDTLARHLGAELPDFIRAPTPPNKRATAGVGRYRRGSRHGCRRGLANRPYGPPSLPVPPVLSGRDQALGNSLRPQSGRSGVPLKVAKVCC